MCVFGGDPKPKVPDALPPIPPPTPPPAPQQVQPTTPLITEKSKRASLKLRRSKADREGAISKGTNQLRVPVNTGTQKSGGINI